MKNIVILASASFILFCGCLDVDHRGSLLVLAGWNNTFSKYSINEEFRFDWNYDLSPDGIWRRAHWYGTGNNLFTLGNATIQSSYTGATGGVLLLTVDAGVLVGGEVQTIGDAGSTIGFGYYEVRMKVTDVPGCCVSFFWKEVNYGPGEIDIEFLTNEAWTATSGTVHYTVHPWWDVYHTAKTQTLSFNPSQDFHRYGFLWTPEKISFTVDGQVTQTYSRPQCQNIPLAKGYIMMNAWTGNANWGGGPSTSNATSVYDWVRFYPNATSIPND